MVLDGEHGFPDQQSGIGPVWSVVRIPDQFYFCPAGEISGKSGLNWTETRTILPDQLDLTRDSGPLRTDPDHFNFRS